jgi:uncharacterized protein YdaT
MADGPTVIINVMPWTTKDYPDSLKNFMAPVRNKAIDIANALLADGNDEQRAIAIATAKAEEWALKRSIKVRKDNAPENKK